MRRHLKRILSLIVILSYVTIHYAAAITDNDGAAFITKAEFDSLKNTFQSELDGYNRNIDMKLESAINAYISGIKIERETNLENKYEIISPTWMKDKRFNKSKKGTKYTSYMSFVEICVATNFAPYVFEGTGDTWYRVKDMTYNASDQEYLYRIGKKKIGSFSDRWSLQDLIKTDYSVTVVGGASGGRGGGYAASDRLLFIQDTTLKKGTNIYFSTWYEPLVIEIWEVDNTTKTKTNYIGTIGGSTGSGEEVAVSVVAADIVESDDTMFYLAGGAIVNDTMYCLNSAEVSLLGDMFATADSNHGSTRQVTMNYEGTAMTEYIRWNYWDYNSATSNYDGGIHAEVYRHKLTEINSTDLLNEVITQNIDEETYYYSGCPLFTATENGTVTFKIKFKNTTGAKTKWALDNKKFTNAANPGSCGDITGCSETTFLADNDDTITVSFDVIKDKTYWIKCEPESGYSSIEFDGNIVQRTRG